MLIILIKLNMANKIINGFENYTITKEGIIKNIKYNMIVKSYLSKDSFMTVNLTLDDKHYKRKINVLVANAYIENVNNYKYVIHIDGNKKNNNFENLKWNKTSRQKLLHRNKNNCKGVHYDSKYNYYVARTKFENKNIHIGTYKNKTDALRAYNNKIIALYGNKAIINIIDE